MRLFSRFVCAGAYIAYLLLCDSSTTRAQVNVESTFFDTPSTGLVGGFSETYNVFSPTSNLLVFGTYFDNGAALGSHSVTGAGVVASNSNPLNERAILSYHQITPGTTSVSFNASHGSPASSAGYFVMEFSGVDFTPGVDVGTSTTITTTSDDRFVVDLTAFNSTIGTGAPAAGSVITDPFTYDINAAAGGATLLAGFGVGGAAGVQNLGWAQGTTSIGEASFGFAQGVSAVNAWNVDGGGDFSVGSNWSLNSAPSPGGVAVFSDALTAPNSPAVISLNAATNLSRLTFTNNNTYEIAGPSALTLSGSAQVLTNSGTHEISASITGSNGLTKFGIGNLLLSGNNTYTGLTDVMSGVLLLNNANSINGNLNVDTQVQFIGDGLGGGFNGPLGGSISGVGNLILDSSLTSETITLNSANTNSGSIQINGGTLAISNSSALGTGTNAASDGVRISSGIGRLALSGNITASDEALIMNSRAGANEDAVHLTSSGNNTWSGNIKGETGGSKYTLESTSGTLMLSGDVTAVDNGDRIFVFSGPGNFNVTGKITDVNSDGSGNIRLTDNNNNDSVSVEKRGSGTLTISTGTNLNDDFWRRRTLIEEGTIEVLSDGGGLDDGELKSASIDIRSGGTLDVGDFNNYSFQLDQIVTGAGTVYASGSTVRINHSNTIRPGDNDVGTLTVNGNLQFSSAAGPGGGSLNFELGNTAAVGGAENDLIAVSGTISEQAGFAMPVMDVNITPVESSLASGTYRLIDAASGSINTSSLTPNVIGIDGSPLTIRQNLALNSSAGNVNLVVSGSSASLSWTGTLGTAWDVNTTSNWSGGPTFFDLDNVIFNDSAGANDTVDISISNVNPGSVTFNSASGNTYTVTGSSGIVGRAPVSLTGNVNVALANNGNVIDGPVSLGAETSLQVDAGDSDIRGVVSGSGNLTVNGGLLLLRSSNTFTSPVVINGGSLNMDSASALGSAAAGTTINAGGTLESNNDTYTSTEPLTFNGGQLSVGFGGTPTFAGPISVQAGGSNFNVGNGGPTQTTVTSNITGNAGGAVNANVLAGSQMTVTSNIANDGNLNVTGGGTLAFGPTTTVAAPVVAVNGSTLDVSAQANFAVQGNQTLVGDEGTVQGNVSASSGSIIRVGSEGLGQQATFQYFDATFGTISDNTTLVDGSAFIPTGGGVGGNNWTERTVFGNGGSVIQGDNNNANPNNSPILKTTIGGFTPGESYTVFVNFWDADSTEWRILADDVLADSGGSNLRTYDSPLDDVEGAIDGDDPNDLIYVAGNEPLTAEGNRQLWGASLGSVTANASGEIEFFVDESGTDAGDDRTWYDGVSISTSDTSAVADVFTIDGDLTMDFGSILEIDLGTPDVSDLLSVTGELIAGGTLDISLDGTVALPSLGDMFDILDFGSATGSFANIILPGLDGGLAWDTSSLLLTGELSVIAGGSLAGDFDSDSDVDGTDFLVWQRNPAIGNLADWQANYGTNFGSLEAETAAVPEPSSIALVGGAALLFAGGMRRRSC